METLFDFAQHHAFNDQHWYYFLAENCGIRIHAAGMQELTEDPANDGNWESWQVENTGKAFGGEGNVYYIHPK